MTTYTLRDLNEKIKNPQLETKGIGKEEFLKFKDKKNEFVIWKIFLSDYTGSAIFFCEKNPKFIEKKTFLISGVKLMFHRGKKKFTFEKLSPRNKSNEFRGMKYDYQTNISLIDYNLI